MRQRTLAEEGFETFRKPTRRERFLTDMDQIIPWRALCKVIEPFYPKPKGAGRPPVGLEKNATRLFVACGLVNLYLARRRLLRATEGTCA